MTSRRFRTSLQVMILFIFYATPAASQNDVHQGHQAEAAAAVTERVTQARPAAGGINVDGRLDEPDWASAPTISNFIQQVPEPGAPARLPTIARVLFSENAIYVGVRMMDPAPDSIVAQLARRGTANLADWVHISFDTHMDRRTAYQFGVNAAGVKRDVRITDDARPDDSWEAVWDVAVHIDDDGWTAEFRIPFSQMRYSGDPDAQVWGFNVQRVVARTGEVSNWAPIMPNTAAFVSVFGEVQGIRIAGRQRQLELLPYVTTRVVQAPGNPDNPYYRRHHVTSGAGLDLRGSATSWLSFNATLNPDFGQVEGDPATVNLSAFEIFQPERRPFFTDGAEFFRISGATLFYSRRVGRQPQLFPPGNALFAERPDRTTILGAAKFTGRSPNGWSVGAMNAITREERARYIHDGVEHTAVVEPRTSYFVGRIARDLSGGAGSVTTAFTATNRNLSDPRLSILHREAYSGGVAVRHRFAEHYETEGSVHFSSVHGDSAAIARTQRAPGRYYQRPDAPHLEFRPGRTSLHGINSMVRLARIGGGNWRYGVDGRAISPGFEINDLGRNVNVDVLEQYAWLGYQQNAAGSLFRRWGLLSYQNGRWTFAGERADFNGMLDFSGEFHNRVTLGLWGMRHKGGISTDHLRGGPAYYNPGSWMGRITAGTDPRQTLSGTASIYTDVLDQGEGSVINAAGSVRWLPSTRTQLTLAPSYRRSHSASQFVASRALEHAGTVRYVLGSLEHHTLSVGARLNHTISPSLTIEMHARPFISSGHYPHFHWVVPGQERVTSRNNRIRTYSGEQIRIDQSGARPVVSVDETGDGTADLQFVHPDFARSDLQARAVVRWEFQPGSTLFLVWSRDSSDMASEGQWDVRRGFDNLFAGSARSALAIKATYLLGL